MTINGTQLTAISDSTTSKTIISFLGKHLNPKRIQTVNRYIRKGKRVEVISWLKHFDLEEALKVTRKRVSKKDRRYFEAHKRYLFILEKIKKEMG